MFSHYSALWELSYLNSRWAFNPSKSGPKDFRSLFLPCLLMIVLSNPFFNINHTWCDFRVYASNLCHLCLSCTLVWKGRGELVCIFLHSRIRKCLCNSLIWRRLNIVTVPCQLFSPQLLLCKHTCTSKLVRFSTADVSIQMLKWKCTAVIVSYNPLPPQPRGLWAAYGRWCKKRDLFAILDPLGI